MSRIRYDLKVGDYVYLIDHNHELEEGTDTSTLYIIKNINTDVIYQSFTMVDIDGKVQVWISDKVKHTIRKLPFKFVRKLKIDKIRDKLRR